MISTIVFSQSPNNQVMVFSGGAMRFTDIKPKSESTKGSVYYNDLWNQGDIYLYSGEMIKNYPLKCDLKNLKVEIKVDTSVKVLNFAAVKKIEWYDKSVNKKTLINCGEFSDFHGIAGFYELISDGKIKLLKKTDLAVVEANYNTLMSVGSKASHYEKVAKYYIENNGKIREIRKGKHPVLKIMSDKSSQIDLFAKENKLSFKKDTDLEKIFDYYNTL